MSDSYDVIVIGGGPAGYHAAIRAAQLGMKSHIYAPDAAGSPAAEVASFHTIAAYDDDVALRVFAGGVDVVTSEFENVPATETYGHVVQCVWQDKWNQLDFAEQAAIKAQQGVQFTHTEMVEVLDRDTNKPVPADGKTIGEIVIRSNTIMKGYHKNQKATEESLSDGFFRSGDLAIRHDTGYVEIKDRLKDIIISGGENISSVEVENVLYRHEGIAFAAVVAKKDDKWGETPCAFVEMKRRKLPLA